MEVYASRSLGVVLSMLLLMVAVTIDAQAEQAKLKPMNQAIPVMIEADRMESEAEPGKETVVVFFGRVEARQGDLVVHSDKMRVYYANEEQGKPGDPAGKTPAGLAGSQKIQKFIATGNVEIIQGNWVGTSDTVEYFDNERKVVLIGHAKIFQGNNTIEGETIEHFLDDGKTMVQRGSAAGERVKVIFFPGSKQTDGQASDRK